MGGGGYLGFDDRLFGGDEVFVAVLLEFGLLDVFYDVVELDVLADQRGILDLDLLFQLIDLMRHSCVLFGQLSDLLLALEQILTVQIPIRSHGLVEVLLVLELGLELLVLLLELVDDIVLDFDLLDGLVVAGMGLGRVDAVLFLLLFEEVDDLVELGGLDLVAADLVLKLLLLILRIIDNLFLLKLPQLLLLNLLPIRLPLPSHILHLLLRIINNLLLLIILLLRIIVLLLQMILPLPKSLSLLNRLILLHPNNLLLLQLFLHDLGQLLVGLHLLVQLDLLIVDLLFDGVNGLFFALDFLLVALFLLEDLVAFLVHLLALFFLLLELLFQTLVVILAGRDFLDLVLQNPVVLLLVLQDRLFLERDVRQALFLLRDLLVDLLNGAVILVNQVLIIRVDVVVLLQTPREVHVFLLDRLDLVLPVGLLRVEHFLLLELGELLVLALLDDLVDLGLLVGLDVGEVFLELDELFFELDVLLFEAGGFLELLLDLFLELLRLLLLLLSQAL